MASYSFVTVWRHQAPIEQVYDAISDSLHWPEWWSTVTAVEEIERGDPDTGIGNVRRYTFKGSLPYTLAFDLAVTASSDHGRWPDTRPASWREPASGRSPRSPTA
jgi:hypothetical protein